MKKLVILRKANVENVLLYVELVQKTELFLMIFKGIWHSRVTSRLLCKCASDIHAEQFYWRKQGENVFIKLWFTKRGFYVRNVFF